MAVITFSMPTDPKPVRTRFTIDGDTLTPKACAVAEALAEPGLWTGVRIHLMSRIPLRDFYTPKHVALLYGPDAPQLDQPKREVFESWWKTIPTPDTIHQILEWEARKFPRFYPIREDGTDLPSSTAARDDDGLTRDQVYEVINQYGRMDVPMDPDTWMRKATKGLDGYPAPARHNGYRSLWSEAAIRAFAAAHARPLTA